MVEYTSEEIKIDSGTLETLEFQDVLDKVKSFSLSQLGKEIIDSLIPNPYIYQTVDSLDKIDEYIHFQTTGEPIPLDGLNDCRAKVHKAKIENAILETDEILKIREFARVCRQVRVFFKSQNEDKKLTNLCAGLFENRILEKHIDDAIDENANVRDTASRELLTIRSRIRDTSNKLRNKIQNILKRSLEDDIAEEDYFTLREGRFVIPLKASAKRAIPGIVHGISNTGNTVFIEPSEVFDLNNELSLLGGEEKREIYRILSNLTEEIRNEAHHLLYSSEILAELDSIRARALYALKYGGIKPVLLEENVIELKNVHHPLLLHKFPKNQVVPLSCNFDEDIHAFLISGPNAGGKTVALKSIGLSVVMALSGIFPFGSVTTNYRTVYASIGDNQSIENNLSTFSSQLAKLKYILDNCENNSLVLVDEICSGTDPYEGSALSSGIMDSFLNIGLFFVVTTHQSSLKTYALTRDKIENASLEFDEDKLQPNYRFLAGVPGNSYAFHLAEALGVSKLVIDRAKSYLGTGNKELEESIAVLGRYKAEAEKLRNETLSEKLKMEKLKDKYFEKVEDIKTKRDLLLNDAKHEAKNILSNANSLVENTIRQIRENSKSIKEIKEEYNQTKKEIEDQVKQIESEQLLPANNHNQEFSSGDVVKISGQDSVGTIVDLDYDNKNAYIDFGGIKFKVKTSNLIKTTQVEKPSKSEYVDSIKFDASTSLNVRGMRADEAIREVDKAISDAISSNLPFLQIIHGIGTGALKKAIHEFLKYHYHVPEFREGRLEEGGAGVTIIDFNN